IPVSDLAERARLGAGAHREVALHGELVAIEVRLQDVELLVAGHGADAEMSAARASREHDRAGGLGVAHPLCPPAWRDKVAATADVRDVDRRGIDAPGRPAANLDEIVVARGKAESDEHAEEPIE